MWSFNWSYGYPERIFFLVIGEASPAGAVLAENNDPFFFRRDHIDAVFARRQFLPFNVITAPPLTDPTYADNARAFNNWLVNDWLSGYPYHNVFVFDFYNVLTTNGGTPLVYDLDSSTGNHHRWWNNAVQHKTDGDNDVSPNVLEYSSGDDHPSTAGNLKATAEFVPLLNLAYNRWKDNSTTTTTTIVVPGGSTTTTTTIRRLCPLRKALGDESEAELEALRQFRDARLAKSAEGARLVGMYYRHAAELTLMFEKRPDIEAQVRELVLELLPQLGAQQKLVLSHDMKEQMFDLIDQLRTDASPGLKKSLRLVRKQIEKEGLELK